jgi:hypothetical protein
MVEDLPLGGAGFEGADAHDLMLDPGTDTASLRTPTLFDDTIQRGHAGMDDRSIEERLEALRRLGETLGPEHRPPLSEAQPLRLRRLGPAPHQRHPFDRAETFFAGPARTAERRWIQPLVAAGLSLTLAGSLVALPLIGGDPSSDGTSRTGAALPAEIPGNGIEVTLPGSPEPNEGGSTVTGPPPAATAPEAPPSGPAPVAPAGEPGETTGDDVTPPPVPPFPPVPPLPERDRPSPPPPPPPQPEPPGGPPGPSLIGPLDLFGEDPTEDEPGEDPTEDEPGEDPTEDEPGEDPAEDEPGEDPAEDEPGEDPTEDEPGEDPTEDEPGDPEDDTDSPPEPPEHGDDEAEDDVNDDEGLPPGKEDEEPDGALPPEAEEA